MRTPALPFAMLLLSIGAPVLAKTTPPAESRICLRNSEIRAQRVGADSGYFVETLQGWWRNTNQSCASFGPNRLAVTQSNNDQQCRGDVVNLVDRSSRLNFGGCSLGKWEKVADSLVPPPFNH